MMSEGTKTNKEEIPLSGWFGNTESGTDSGLNVISFILFVSTIATDARARY